jgi:hypothetical protein
VKKKGTHHGIDFLWLSLSLSLSLVEDRSENNSLKCVIFLWPSVVYCLILWVKSVFQKLFLKGWWLHPSVPVNSKLNVQTLFKDSKYKDILIFHDMRWDLAAGMTATGPRLGGWHFNSGKVEKINRQSWKIIRQCWINPTVL